MRSAELSLEKYDTDKITNRYLDRYDAMFEPWVKKPIVLLELGVAKGGSLSLWRDYFPGGTIVGIDVKLPEGFHPTERIHVAEGSQADPRFLSRIANRFAPSGFDIIIDDASHIGELTKIAFWHLFDNHLKPDGLYVIEDWGTGYWDDWPDGKRLDPQTNLQSGSSHSLLWLKMTNKFRLNRLLLKSPLPCHSYGMVGLVKQLVDEQGAHDVTRANWRGKAKRLSKFQDTLITPCMVFVRKAGSEPDID
jgi:hypothetical protein